MLEFNSNKIMNIYNHMQAAVDMVGRSPHPTNKIAASIAGKNADGNEYAITRYNHWPYAIENTIGTDTKIGNSSGTIHAETACILDAPKTDGAKIFITDPPCPNCMKNMAEAGINALYIDHKGFDKDWAKRRGDSFESMSMRIAAKAGIDVYVIYRKEQRFETISRHAMGYKPPEENPAEIYPAHDDFETAIQNAHQRFKEEPFAIALTTDAKDENFYIAVDSHPTIGYTSETIEDKNGKYSFIIQPMNRILMIAAREGLIIEGIYSSRTPTSRELVNMIGAGISSIQIGDKEKARDDHGLKALENLINSGVLHIQDES